MHIGNTAEFRAQRRALLVGLFACRNCRANPGEECKHDYGCTDADRCLNAASVAGTLIEQPSPSDPAMDQLGLQRGGV